MKNLSLRIALSLMALLVLNTNTNAHTYSEPKPQNEEILDVVLDLYFVGSSAMHVVTTGTGWTALALDVGCLFIPGATGAGSVYRAAKHTPDIISTGKNVLTKGQASRHATHFGTKVTNIAKTKVDELIDAATRKKFSNIKWKDADLQKFLKHVSDGHSGAIDLAKRQLDSKIGNTVTKFTGVTGKEGMQKMMNEAMQKMANGQFIMKTDATYAPYNFVMITVDMGKQIGTGLGKNGDYFKCTAINMFIGPNGHGTMYPVKNAYSGAKKGIDKNIIYNIIKKM